MMEIAVVAQKLYELDNDCVKEAKADDPIEQSLEKERPDVIKQYRAKATIVIEAVNRARGLPGLFKDYHKLGFESAKSRIIDKVKGMQGSGSRVVVIDMVRGVNYIG